MNLFGKSFSIVLVFLPVVLSFAAYGWKAFVIGVGTFFGAMFLHLWGYERGFEEGRKR